MTTPSLWQVRSQLVTVFRDACRASTGPARTAEVVEGNRARGETPPLFLLVGAVGGIGADLAVIGDDRWGRYVSAPDPMAVNFRSRQGEIDCAAVAWSGSAEDLPRLRDAAEAIVETCEAALVANPRLSGLLEFSDDEAWLQGAEYRDPHTNKGPYAEVTFTVAYRARAVF